MHLVKFVKHILPSCIPNSFISLRCEKLNLITLQDTCGTRLQPTVILESFPAAELIHLLPLTVLWCVGVTIGKRYARTDELGVPFAITVDYETIKDGEHKGSVTLRERDTTEQVRVPIAELIAVVKDLCDQQFGTLDWKAMKAKYPVQTAPVDGET
jgi:hypothetical protein